MITPYLLYSYHQLSQLYYSLTLRFSLVEYAPPEWAVAGTELDERLFSAALAYGAPYSELRTKENTHRYLDSKRAERIGGEMDLICIVKCTGLN